MRELCQGQQTRLHRNERETKRESAVEGELAQLGRADDEQEERGGDRQDYRKNKKDSGKVTSWQGATT